MKSTGYLNKPMQMLTRIFLILSVTIILSYEVALAQNKPLQLWYNKPARVWTEALPIGNGRMAAMIFGGIGEDRIQFNEETLWTGEPRDYNRKGAYVYLDTLRQLLFAGKRKEAEQLAEAHFMGTKSAAGRYQADYQPFGDLYLKFHHDTLASDYKRSLDLTNAIATTSYTINGIRYTREYLASQPQQAIAIRLSANKKASISFDAILGSPHESTQLKKINNNTIAVLLKVKNGVLEGAGYLQVRIKNGTITINSNSIHVVNADEAECYVTAATSFVDADQVGGKPESLCTGNLQKLESKTWQQIREAHVREYQQYFNTFSIQLEGNANEHQPTDERLAKFASSNDPAFVALYVQYGRYLLIAASRPGSHPANLQGKWNDLLSPPWGSKYTTNINAEMNYWPAESLNLSPLHFALFRLIDEVAKKGEVTAREYYHAPGWVLHHNTDLWRGTSPINAANHGIWVTGGAWLCQHLWEHYSFTQDRDFLQQRAYPVIKKAAQFFLSFLIKDPQTGWLISSPSNSPEQGGLVAGPTMDHQIIRDLFKNTIASAEILGIDKAFSDTLRTTIKQIAPNQIGKYGQLQEWLQDVDDTANRHRHISHLWALHPGNEINWDETPELTRAARQSLLYRGDAATGWSLGWKINCWARLKDGNHSFKLMQMLLSPVVKKSAGSYPNLFDAHPPFQIDGNFGGAAGVGEMLLQSHTKYIDILPALPDALPTGEVKGICARGGFELTIRWKNGQLQQLTVLSKAGNELQLRYKDEVVKMKTTKNGTLKFNGSLKRI